MCALFASGFQAILFFISTDDELIHDESGEYAVSLLIECSSGGLSDCGRMVCDSRSVYMIMEYIEEYI